MTRALWRTASKVAVALYKVSGGRIGGRVRGLQVVLLTVPGRKTGQPHTTAVSWFERGDGYVVVGSAGGMPQEPQWFRNLRKAPTATVQIGRQLTTADVRLLQGQERDEVWRDVVLARAPFFADYEVKGNRTLPLAMLTPRR